ncbi:hypothetical protein HYY69_01260 [Candidatus Woesearchaeota archaeon]|nr:hypothetical protein [Candidatus Woesearchaeota archaeon]
MVTALQRLVGKGIKLNSNLKVHLSKKGQITTFIIVGLVVLFIVLLVLYLSSKFNVTEKLSFEKKDQVSVFVENCVSQVTDDALEKLGQQAGHLYLDKFEIYTAQYDPFNANVLSLDNGNSFLPYWLYQRRNGVDKSEMPQLYKQYKGDDSIQDQLERYIRDGVEQCVNNFVSFNSKGILVNPKGELSIAVLFGEEDVQVKAEYPLEVTTQNNVENVNSFSTTKQVRLKQVYALARNILQYETNTVFLEDNVIALASLYGRNHDASFPAMYGGIEVKDCTEMDFWLVEDVKTKFKSMLQQNVPFFRVENAKPNPVEISIVEESNAGTRQVRQGTFKIVSDKISNKQYQDINVWFNYDESYPFYLYLGSGGAVFPQRLPVDALLLNFCIYEYKFVYDLTFPMVISLQDKESLLKQKPYYFQFPVQTIIKENYPRVRILDLLNPDAQTQPLTSECSSGGQSNDQTIKVIDTKTKKPIEKALVYFQCGPEYLMTYKEDNSVDQAVKFADRCFMGNTNAEGIYQGKLPLCGGGAMVTIDKQDYATTTQLVGNVLEDAEVSTQISLLPLKTFTVDVQKFFAAPPLTKGETSTYQGVVLDDNNKVVACNLNPKISPVQTNEQVYITLEHINTLGGSIGRTEGISFVPGQETALKLGSGRYHAELMMLRHERYPGEMTFKKHSQSIKIPSTIATKAKTIYYPEEDVLLPSTVSGGSEFTFEIGISDLDKDKITFYVIDEGQPKYLEQIGIASQHTQACYQLNQAIMKPRIG